MGEVYRARDPRLGREVALKVLLEVFARDPERMARFDREAQVLASLSHQNIAILHGLEESGSGRALVMELVEGPTLAEQIAAGPVAVEEALPIARQIAEALEYAHDCGVVHRDLKPANVKVKPDGTVKVLDFGLAKALEADPGPADSRHSPTLSLAATRTGVLLGTAAYMAPEQAKGKPADRRADIWAFGAVLAEMLAGRPIYSGDTVAETLAAVLMKDPNLDALPAGTPAAIRRLLGRCLEKEPRQRLQAIGEARIVIEQALRGAPEEVPVAAPAPAPAPAPSRLPWVMAGVLALSTAALAFLHFRGAPTGPEGGPRVLRYSISPPEKTSIHSFAISPDGRSVAMAASAEGKRQLWLRALDAVQPQALAGTDEAQYPFWSPDSRWIGFFAQGKLRKIAASGGPAQTLCDAQDGRGGAWNRDGVIVFAPSPGATSLHRVAAVGGMSTPVTKTERSPHRFPVFLPDGRRFLYQDSRAAEEKRGMLLGSLDSQPARRLLADNSNAAWVPPAAGSENAHVLFIRESTLMAQPVNPKTLQPAGELFPVAEQVSLWLNGWAPVSASENGVLVYRAGSGGGGTQLSWHDRAGKELGKVGAPGQFWGFALSPDEKMVAVPRLTGAGADIWLQEPARGVDTRFTFHASLNHQPVWSPDGRRIVFSSNRGGRSDLYVKDTSGAGQDERLLQAAPEMGRNSCDWSRDGRSLLYVEQAPKTRFDLWVVPWEGDRKPVVFLQTEFNETQGQFSPGPEGRPRWIAYASDESGRYEIYVRPFPGGASGPTGKWKVSAAGGQFPRWRRDGKELFYLSPERRLMSVAVKTEGVLEATAPQPLFDTRVPFIAAGFNNFAYAVAADGKRFLVASTGVEAAETPLTVEVNWLAGVKR